MLFTLGFFMDEDSFLAHSSPLQHTEEKNDKTVVTNINNVRIANAEFDTLYVDDDNEKDYTTQPTDWTDGSTVMFGKFDNSVDTSDVEFDVGQVQYFKVFRREHKNIYDEWTELYTKPIKSASDFIFTLYDKFVKSKTKYEYAIVPYFNNQEGQWKISEPQDVNFEGLYVLDSDNMYGTIIEPSLSYNRYNNTGVVNTLHNKYPYTVKNGQNNYDAGNVSGKFGKIINCVDLEQDNIVAYTKEIIDFLTNGTPKILKFYDGNAWIVSITNNPQVEYPDIYYLPQISFDWTEIGDVNSTEDLENSGLYIEEGDS